MIRERIDFYQYITTPVDCIDNTNIQQLMPCEGMEDDQCYNEAKDKYKISCKISSIEEYFCGLTFHYKQYSNIFLFSSPQIRGFTILPRTLSDTCYQFYFWSAGLSDILDYCCLGKGKNSRRNKLDDVYVLDSYWIS